MPGGWVNSTRRDRLPADWRTVVRPAVHERNPEHICHLCGTPGGDAVDHKKRGDDHSLENLDWVHQDVAPYCHRYKSSAEGVAAQPRERRARERHPGLL